MGLPGVSIVSRYAFADGVWKSSDSKDEGAETWGSGLIVGLFMPGVEEN